MSVYMLALPEVLVRMTLYQKQYQGENDAKWLHSSVQVRNICWGYVTNAEPSVAVTANNCDDSWKRTPLLSE